MSNKDNIQAAVEKKYPMVDCLPKETGYHENDVAEKQQEAFIAGAEWKEQIFENIISDKILEIEKRKEETLEEFMAASEKDGEDSLGCTIHQSINMELGIQIPAKQSKTRN